MVASIFSGAGSRVTSELQGQPATLLVLAGVVLFCFWSYTNHALASDLSATKLQVAAINAQLVTVELKIERARIEASHDAIESELFDIGRQLEHANATGGTLPEVFHTRASELRILHERRERELERIEKALEMHGRAVKQ